MFKKTSVESLNNMACCEDDELVATGCIDAGFEKQLPLPQKYAVGSDWLAGSVCL